MDLSDKQIRLFKESERLKTFDSWPHGKDWDCTPAKLAQAGFYYSPCPDSDDNVCCVFCTKELDGWEPKDDPMKEHSKHSKSCPYLLLLQPVSWEEMTVKEFFQFLQDVSAEKFDKKLKKKYTEYQEQAASIRKAIINHVMGEDKENL